MTRNGVPERHEQVQIVDQPPQPATGGQPLPPPDARKPPRSMSVPELRAEEPGVLSYLFDAEERRNRQVGTLEIPWRQVPQYDDDGKVMRDDEGKPLLGAWTIHFRRLSQDELVLAAKRAKKIWQVGEEGRREFVPDPVEVGNWLVYLATVPEERSRPGGWDDKRLWDHYHVGNGSEVPSKFLTPGEMATAIQLVNDLAGLPRDERFLPSSENPSAAGEAS